MTVQDIVTPFLGNIVEFAQKVAQADIRVVKNAIINYREKQIEYELQIILPNEGSKRESLAEKVQSYFRESFIIDKVISYNAIIVPNSYDLKDKEIVKLTNGKFELDMGRLVREIKFDIATFKIIVSISEEILDGLVIPTKSASGLNDGSRIRARLEVSIDYAGAWYRKYDRFEIRDIEYYENIIVAPATIGEVMPAAFYTTLMTAARAYQVGQRDALKFFPILNNNFLLFEDERYYSKILATVTTDVESFQVVDVIPKMQTMELLPGGPNLVLPGSFRIRIRTSIAGEEIVKKANAFIDVEKLKAIFSEMIALTRIQTRHFTF